MPPSLLPYESIISQSARHCQWLASRNGLMTLSPAKCCSLSCQRFHFATFGESFLAECEHVLGLINGEGPSAWFTATSRKGVAPLVVYPSGVVSVAVRALLPAITGNRRIEIAAVVNFGDHPVH